MINRVTAATLAIVLACGFGAVALAASGGPSNGTNAAISQYETTPVTPVTPGGHEVEGTHESGGHGVKGVHESGGTKHPGGKEPKSESAGHGGEVESAPVETAATGPVSAASGLPFTGYDALLLAGVGLLLVLAGVAQRRFGLRRHVR
jgi:hypothetical protein